MTKMPSTAWFPESPQELQHFLASLQNMPAFTGDADDAVIRVGIYTRKSRLKPGHTDYSMESQADQATAYAARQGWEVYDTYGDLNISGRYTHRKELNRLKRDIRAGQVDVVLVYSINRIFRNLRGLMEFLKFIQEYGVRLVSVTEPIDTNAPWGMLILEVLGALAEMFVREASERTRLMKRQRARNGLLNGLLPLGI
ncbi:recombinase family protein, partial [Candidatus Parcubacteria bacterium]